MRVYTNLSEMLNETARDLLEMGVVRKTKTMQDLDISDNPEFDTKELMNFTCCITNPNDGDADHLFKTFSIVEDYRLLKSWCDQEFKDRVDDRLLNPGNAWNIRKKLWAQFMTKHQGRFAYTYNERIRDQLTYIIEALDEDVWTRQAVLAIWNPTIDAQRIGRDRVPCSLNYHFMTELNSEGETELNLVYTMRSCDFVTHMLADIYMAICLLTHVALQVTEVYKVGKLFLNMHSLHYYQKDEDALKSFMEKI